MKHSFLIIFWLGISILSVTAQTNSCDLQLNVYQYQQNPAVEPEKVENVTANIKNLNSQRVIKAGFQNEMMPIFSNLPNGKYLATITLKGYKTTTKEIELTCATEQTEASIIENMFLWNGSSKETVKMFGTLFTVGKKDDEPITAPQQNTSSLAKQETINGRAASLPKPDYPPAARAIRASGAIRVQVTIDELGKVVSAKALDGHPVLRASAEKAAKESKFESTRLQDIPVKITGVIVYNFIP